MVQNHIDDDTLRLFVATTSFSDDKKTGSNNMENTAYQDTLDHLAGCEECRNQVSMFSTLQEKWIDISQRTELTDEQHRLICDYIDGVLQPDEAKEVQKLIETQPGAMKAALHYQCHSDSMQQAFTKNDTDHERNRNQSVSEDAGAIFGSFMNMLRQIFVHRSPMIYTMAVTASVFATILVLVQLPAIQQGQVMIASYQDNPTIQFTEQNKLPGIGFFSQAGSDSKPFKDITVELIAENTIKISWPEVEGATLYKMRIQVFNQGKKTILKENSSQTNHTTFQLGPYKSDPDKLDIDDINGHNRRYEWVLYGNTRDDRMFYASGGFVISSVDTEADIW